MQGFHGISPLDFCRVLHSTAVLVIVINVPTVRVHKNTITRVLGINLDITSIGGLFTLASGYLDYLSLKVDGAGLRNEAADCIPLDRSNDADSMSNQKDGFAVHRADRKSVV